MYLIVRNLGSLINFFLEDIMTIHKFKPWHYLLRKYISVAKWGWEPSIYWRNIGEIGNVGAYKAWRNGKIPILASDIQIVYIAQNRHYSHAF